MDRRQALRRALPDVIAGGIFVAFGLAFGLESLNYPLGSLGRMGPGLFPLLLAVCLVALGVLIMGSGFVTEEERPIGYLPWRGMLLLSIAFVFFGLTVRGLGVVPALFVTTLLAGLASVRVSFIGAVVIATGLTALSVVIFIYALQLRLPLFGPWVQL